MMLFGTTLTRTAISADWSYNSDISLGLEYTDNLFFRSEESFNGGIADTIVLFVPAFSVLAVSETSRTQLDFGVSVERYDRITEADRNDPYVRLIWDTIQETYSLGLGLGYIQTSTRTSELESTGQVNIFGTQTRSSIEPYWLINANESNSLRIGLNLQSISYDVANLINYNNYGLLADWFYDYSDASTINLNAGINRYDSEEIGLDFDYGSILGGMNYQASEALNLSFSLGVGYGLRKVGDNYTTGLLNASLIYQQEYYSTSITISSNLVPTSRADLRQINALRFVYNHQITESSEFHINASLSESFRIDETNEVSNEVLIVRPGLSFRMTQDWYFDTWYQYRSNRSAISENSGYIGIIWRTE